MRLDLGAGDAPVPPLADKAGRQEVAVEAQVEFQGLSSVIQFIEGEKLAPGGRRPAVEHSVGQVVGQERSTLINFDGMNDVAAGRRRSRLWGDRGSAVSFGVPQPLSSRGPGTQIPAGSASRCPLLPPRAPHGAGTGRTRCPRGSGPGSPRQGLRSRVGWGAGAVQLWGSAPPRTAPGLRAHAPAAQFQLPAKNTKQN